MRISSRVALWVVLIISVALLSAVAVSASKKAPAKHVKKISAVCPVMGNAVPDITKAAGKSVYKGKTYYFCCPACKPMFDANPAKYVKVVKAKPATTSGKCTSAPQSGCKDGVCPLPKTTKNVSDVKKTKTTNHANKPK